MYRGPTLSREPRGEPVRYKLSALGVAVVVAALALFGALRGPAADRDPTRQSPQPEQNALQEDLATEPAPTCGGDRGDRLGMANPAATYCKELGYEYRITQTDKGEQGICVFPDGGECEEWKFLAGKCGRQRSYCAKQGLDLVTKTDGKNPLSREYAVCVDHGEEIGPVSGLMGLSQKATRSSLPVLGSEPPPDQEPVTGTPPSSFDWRSENGQNWMTFVKNQGSCGSCWAFSAVGIVEGTYNVDSGNPDLDLDLSEEYLVSDCYTMGSYGNCCGGSHVDALEFVRDSGIPDEGCMPYVDQSSCTCGSSCDSNCAYRTGGDCSDTTCSDRCADWQDRAVTIDTVAPVPSGQIKQYLVDRGPLAVAMGVGSSYGGGFDAQGVYRCTNDSVVNHAVVIAGYSDAGGYWIVKNSWGATWNGDGYFNVGYGECAIETWPYYVDTLASACAGDVDCDGVLDGEDNCPTIYNPDQANTPLGPIENGPVISGDDTTNPYEDRVGDACDDDADNDWLNDADEATHGTDPNNRDTDGDRVLDGAEVMLGSNPNDPNSWPVLYPPNDSDGDGIPANVEAAFGSSDNNKDSDGDGINDATEIKGWGTSPVLRDSDGDVCDDNIEIADVNGDGLVNVGDQMIIAQRAGKVRDDDFDPDPPWNFSPAFDINKDGYINVGDQMLVAKQSGKRCG